MDNFFLKRFLKNSLAVTVGSLSGIFFHFISITLLTRHFAKEEFGVYVFVILVSFFLSKLSGLGLDMTLVKFISGDDCLSKGHIIWAILRLRVVSVVTVSILFYLIGPWGLSLFAPESSKFAVDTISITVFMSFRDLFYKLFEGLGTFFTYITIQISSAVLRVGLIFCFLISANLDLDGVLKIEIATIFLTVCAQILTGPLKKIRRSKENAISNKELLKFSAPIYLNNILTFFYDNMNMFVIGGILSPAGLASYDVAQKVPAAFLKLFGSIIIVYFPSASSLFSQGKTTEARNFMDQYLSFCISGMLLVATIAFIFQKEIILLLFTSKYASVSMAFAFLMFNCNLRIMANIFGYSIVSAGYSSIPVKTNAISCCIGMASSIFLIQTFGYMGAVFSLILMNLSTLLIYLWHLWKIGIPPESGNPLKQFILYLIIISTCNLVGRDVFAIKTIAAFTYVILSLFYFKNGALKSTLKFLKFQQK